MEVELFTNGMAEDEGYEVHEDIVSVLVAIFLNESRLVFFQLSGIQNLDVICGDMVKLQILARWIGVFVDRGTGLLIIFH